MSQVISQFATISSDAGEGSYPEPAATFVSALSLTSFEFLGFVPLGCVASGVTFYHKVVFKVTAPAGIIILLWCYPLYYSMRGLPNTAEKTKLKGLAMLLLELVLPTISTSLVKDFVCQQFDSGAFLAEELTTRCDDSTQRALWVAFASISLVVYVLGGKFDLLVCCFESARFCCSDRIPPRCVFCNSSDADVHDHVPSAACDQEARAGA